MVGLILQMLRLVQAVTRMVRDPRGRALALLVAFQLLAGTVFYSTVEGWRWLDSAYFSVTTLTTVGFGDLTPETDLGKVFTIVYLFTGVGLLVSFVALVAEKSGRKATAEGHKTDEAT